MSAVYSTSKQGDEYNEYIDRAVESTNNFVKGARERRKRERERDRVRE